MANIKTRVTKYWKIFTAIFLSRHPIYYPPSGYSRVKTFMHIFIICYAHVVRLFITFSINHKDPKACNKSVPMEGDITRQLYDIIITKERAIYIA